MTTFTTRYKNLNTKQREAVDIIDGPLLVIAGPGTGKTELLSMRAANILQKTDALPESILCLTFTESGADAMRERLSTIIGSEAYKVAIHTFHSFGSEVINQNRAYFYQGAEFSPTDELGSFAIIRSILDELDYTNPLASKKNGEYTHLNDISRSISELKQAGLSSDELLQVITANETLLDATEKPLAEIFAHRMSIKMIDQLAPIAQHAAQLAVPALPPAITPLSDGFALSLARALDEARDINKTTPLTAWRKLWLEQDETGNYVFKDRKRFIKLRALSHVYFSYLSRMEQAGLYDYDDMILDVIHGMETQSDLKFNLQEKYQYIMVDEFQDTNLAQLRVLFGLTDSPINEGRPNIMAVGDDDQAIYSFQGADVNNIHRFIAQYRDVSLVTLVDNYRSSAAIIESAREVICQGGERLEASIEAIDKTLTAHQTPNNSFVELYELSTSIQERQWIAQSIRHAIDNGEPPASIAVLAKRHQELVALLPYLYAEGIAVNYERRDNVLDFQPIKAIELIARIASAYASSNFDVADGLLPELLAHPAFAFSGETVWKLSLQAWQRHQTWGETMLASPDFAPLADWLIDLSQRAKTQTLETVLDYIIGKREAGENESDTNTYTSPLYNYYFSEERLKDEPDAYLTYLEALRTLRSKLREFRSSDKSLLLKDLLTFIDLHRQLNAPITTIRQRAETEQGAINLMSAHKSKGLEYDHVYILGAIDSTWGQRVHTPSRLISYPENLAIAPAGSTYNERLRLFFVAMTRAKKYLTISYSLQNDNTKATLPASFLVGTRLSPITIPAPQSIHDIARQLEIDWQQRLLNPPTTSLRELLQPQLDHYKLSATHLNNFLDISRGGPLTFLANNLLRFPQAKSANASYGTAIHSVLQQAHDHIAATGKPRPIEDLLGIFEKELQKQRLSTDDVTFFNKRGLDALNAFLSEHYQTFSKTQKTELNFANQNVFIGDAHLTGSLDLVDFTKNTITVTDYKTGAPSREWKGKTDYEKIKLHKYRQQLMFYELLVKHSRDYGKYDFNGAVLQFVEPDKQGTLHSLSTTFSEAELERFSTLISAVWRHIMTLDLPDTSLYEQNYKGILQFEQELIENISTNNQK